MMKMKRWFCILASLVLAGCSMAAVAEETGDFPALNDAGFLDSGEFVFEDESKVIVRPSGTEPKIKIYLFSHGDDAKKAQQIIEENEARMRQIMQAE